MRIWNSSNKDDGSIHVLGNGRLCVYEQGPDITQIFGEPYSSASIASAALTGENIEARSKRTPGTAIWTHVLYRDGREICEMTDLVDSETCCFIRKIKNAGGPLRFRLALHPNAALTDITPHYSHSRTLFFKLNRGEKVYSRYAGIECAYHLLGLIGSVGYADGEIVCDPGESFIIFSGAQTYHKALTEFEAALGAGFDALLARTSAWWNEFTGKRRDFAAMIPESLPMREKLLSAADSVAVLIKAQQSEQGGVLAGHAYHMAYIRDMYGVFRGLLFLGHTEEARAIIDYLFSVWSKYGFIRNAQAMGVDGLFHVHENDNSEITGYLILESFNYLRATGDDAYISKIFPMLLWAFEVQAGELRNGMLPFNGDETYVPGGVLPRSSLQDGSAEATMLFVKSGGMLLEWAKSHDFLTADKLEQLQNILNEVKKSYPDNFYPGGDFISNNPDRLPAGADKRFRHGVCEGCHDFEWLENNGKGRYLCPKCYVSKQLEQADRAVYRIRPVSLMPYYIDSDLIPGEILKKNVTDIYDDFKKTGKLPSRPDGSITVGYDYGFLLYALTSLHHPGASEIFEKTLSILDPTEAWVEYYTDGRPRNTRCRPWESAINIEACLRYALSVSGHIDLQTSSII